MDENLQKGEIVQATISKKALLVAWLSIPSFIIIPYLAVYVPSYIKMLIKGEIKKAIADAAGVGETISASQAVKQQAFGFIPSWLVGFISFFIGLLVFAWLCWAIVFTIKHFDYKLYYNDVEVYGKTGSREITIPLDQINNIFIEKSIWGKLFNYGTITISSTKGSISIKNVARAREFAKGLAHVSIEKNGSFVNF